MVLNLDYEYSLITGKRKFNLAVPVRPLSVSMIWKVFITQVISFIWHVVGSRYRMWHCTSQTLTCLAALTARYEFFDLHMVPMWKGDWISPQAWAVMEFVRWCIGLSGVILVRSGHTGIWLLWVHVCVLFDYSAHVSRNSLVISTIWTTEISATRSGPAKRLSSLLPLPPVSPALPLLFIVCAYLFSVLYAPDICGQTWRLLAHTG